MDKPYRTRMVVDIGWTDVPDADQVESVRSRAEVWFRSAPRSGILRADVTPSMGLPDSVEVRVRLDGGEALLLDTDRGDWTELEPVREDTHGNRVFKPLQKPEG